MGVVFSRLPPALPGIRFLVFANGIQLGTVRAPDRDAAMDAARRSWPQLAVRVQSVASYEIACEEGRAMARALRRREEEAERADGTDGTPSALRPRVERITGQGRGQLRRDRRVPQVAWWRQRPVPQTQRLLLHLPAPGEGRRFDLGADAAVP